LVGYQTKNDSNQIFTQKIGVSSNIHSTNTPKISIKVPHLKRNNLFSFLYRGLQRSQHPLQVFFVASGKAFLVGGFNPSEKY